MSTIMQMQVPKRISRSKMINNFRAGLLKDGGMADAKEVTLEFEGKNTITTVTLKKVTYIKTTTKHELKKKTTTHDSPEETAAIGTTAQDGLAGRSEDHA